MRTAPATRAEREARDAHVEARLEALARSTGSSSSAADCGDEGKSSSGSGGRSKGQGRGARERARRFADCVVDGGRSLRANAAHPAVAGNVVFAVALVAGGVACFERVQQRLRAHSLPGWQALGLGAAVLGAVGVVDYYASA
jgi:hypothetical protein